MTPIEIKHLFILECYGTMKAYKKARRKDYYKVQFEWSCFIDNLCRDGIITQIEYEKAIF